ncbi:Suf-domain-containing protein [Cystobasidium minutum MCA 4210]|uniref:Suf-domain-containing protein n=1 Tax=Cystobasidium minutum MCA 4210 TaxID=1397322 RepID=UPI0034CE3772|eukprot:jgi/Rhomi1/143259/e_gw1.3.389.1
MDTQAQSSTPNPSEVAEKSSSGPYTNPATLQEPDSSQPVPGLSVPESYDTPASTPQATANDAASSSYSSAAHTGISQIQQEATPAGTPTLASATLPSSSEQPQSQQAQTAQPSTASSQIFPSSSQPVKATPLATDPNLAREKANELIQAHQSKHQLSRLQKLRQRIEKDKFDGEAWLELINDALQKGDLEKTREIYSNFLKNFPDNAREWIAYADLELSHGNNDRVNEIFGRCLRTSTSVQLWHFYLTYIRRTNPIDRSSPERATPARDIITKAFEFSLAHVGADLEAGPIWFDYIEFLKEGDVAGTWEAQQKMDKLRQTYQRAVCIPLSNIEQLWQGYDAFENNLNRATAKRFLQDRSPAYMTARAMARQLQSFMGRLSFSPVPRRPNWDSIADQTQLRVWKEMLKYEESDPLELGDQASVRTRVLLAYKKALTQLRFYPEIWYMAAAYAKAQDKADEAVNFYKAGMEANPTSLLLHYAFAEHEESKGHNEECHRVYNGLIERLQAEIDATNTAMQTEIKEALEEKERIEAQEKAMRNQNMMKDEDDEDQVGADVRNQEKESIKQAIIDSKTEHLNELKRLAASVWIMQMRFARRAEGIQQARGVFSRARKWPHVGWQVFEASAMLEMHWNKETKIATNVFEVGLKRFSDEVGFVKRYLDFLIMINDDGNARAVFERTITKLPADKAEPLWNRWSEYLYQYGDLASIQKIDARLAETYTNVPAIDRFVERHTYLDLDDMAYVELGEEDQDSSSTPKKQPQSPSPPPQQQAPPMMPMPGVQQVPMPGGPPMPAQMPPQMPPHMQHQPGQNGNAPPMMPPQQGPPQIEAWGRNMNNNAYPAPSSVDGSADNDRRRNAGNNAAGGRGGNKRRRSPSPPSRRGRRGNSPPRVSRHTPPDDFPEGIPWLMSQLASKTVFAAHGPILDWQHLLHLITTTNLPPTLAQQQSRGRERSLSPQRRGPQAGRES